MKPGREMDRLIAEKVMGWQYWDMTRDWWGAKDATFFSVGEDYLSVYENGAYEASFYWRPSESAADALDIIDHMSCTTKEFWTLQIFSSGFTAQFQYSGGRDLPWVEGTYESAEPTLAETICRAALMAVGIHD